MAQVPLIKGDAIGVETDYRDALPVNMVAVERPILGARGYMNSFDGLTSLGTGQGIDRGANYHENEEFEDQYRVSGTDMISVSAAGATVVLGTISGTEQVSMPYSFNTQAIIADGKMFLYDTVGGFREVTDGDLGNPIDCVWVDGFYFLTDGTNIYHTDLLDESSIDPLKFDTAEFSPDQTLGLSLNQDNKVMVWGRYTLEYFVRAVQDNFKFIRVPNRAQKIGIVATHAKCETSHGWYIVGGGKNESLSVHFVTLGATRKAGTREIDKILEAYTEPELSDIRMETRMDDDVTYVLIHLPNETLCFNETITEAMGPDNAWSILQSTGGINYRAINGAFDGRSAKWVYGDKLNSALATIDNTTAGQYTVSVPWTMDTPLLMLEKASVDRLEIETIPGQTAVSGEEVFISQTNDGVNYTSEVSVDYGEPGEYDTRFILRRLGNVDDWVSYHFRGNTTERMTFAMLDIEYG